MVLGWNIYWENLFLMSCDYFIAWLSSIHTVGQRPWVHRSSRKTMDCSCWSEDGLYRTRQPLGERILWEFQRQVQRWIAQCWNILQSASSTDHHRRMEETLQHKETTQCTGLSPTSSWNHHTNGSEANHALTFNMDQSGEAAQDIYDRHPIWELI